MTLFVLQIRTFCSQAKGVGNHLIKCLQALKGKIGRQVGIRTISVWICEFVSILHRQLLLAAFAHGRVHDSGHWLARRRVSSGLGKYALRPSPTFCEIVGEGWLYRLGCLQRQQKQYRHCALLDRVDVLCHRLRRCANSQQGIGISLFIGVARAELPFARDFVWLGVSRASEDAPFPMSGMPIVARPATLVGIRGRTISLEIVYV